MITRLESLFTLPNLPLYKEKSNKNENDFLVKEVLSEKAIDSFDNLDGHAVYLLKKSGIDTNHALIDIEKRYGLVLKALGLKDAHAQTEQYVYTYKKIRFTSRN